MYNVHFKLNVYMMQYIVAEIKHAFMLSKPKRKSSFPPKTKRVLAGSLMITSLMYAEPAKWSLILLWKKILNTEPSACACVTPVNVTLQSHASFSGTKTSSLSHEKKFYVNVCFKLNILFI